MNRVFRVQIAKLLKEKEDLVRKCQQHLDGHQQPGNNHNVGANSPSPVEMQKLVHENSILRIEKKRVEDQLQVIFFPSVYIYKFLRVQNSIILSICIAQVMKESEQHRFENMRSLLDDKARELTLFQKQLRQQIARLVSVPKQIFNLKKEMNSYACRLLVGQ